MSTDDSQLDRFDDTPPRWSGMPDPHRHNPFAVGLLLVVAVSAAWSVVMVLVLAMIGGLVG